jgi:hypothetical protein
MKKTLSVLLAILMLIPAFACFAFAGGAEDVLPLAESSYEGTNIASLSTIEFGGATTGKVDPSKIKLTLKGDISKYEI